MTDLKDRTLLVTGGGKKLGRYFVKRLLEEGFQHLVTTCWHSCNHVPQDPRVTVLRQNFQEGEAAQALVNELDRRGIAVDILVNNAGVFEPTDPEHLTQAHWRKLMHINLKTPYLLAVLLGLRMKQRGWGRIVNIVDVWGLRPLKGYSVYSISKAGLVMATRSLAVELAPEVQVNALAPGPIWFPEAMSSEERRRAVDRVPLKRKGEPEELFQALLFLLRAPFMTGVVLPVDGGRLVR